ncbi:MAG: EAL domain-containing protein [Steroidobacteraceae bacterium]
MHVAIYAPALFVDASSSPRGSTAKLETALVSDLLWPLIRECGEPQIINRVRLRADEPLLPYRFIVCPLCVDGKVEGLIAGIRPQSEARFSRRDLAVLNLMLPEVRRSLHNRLDEPTGLLRLTAFEAEVAFRRAHPAPACVVYADLDQVHAINDLCGFHAGDEAIRKAGQLLRSLLVSGAGIAAHLSGDRYVAVLFGHTLNRAGDWAECLRQAIEHLELPDQVTASLGVATLPESGELQHALAQAETACRVAKERGRNRVELYDSGDGTIIRRHAQVRASRRILEALEGSCYVLHAQPIVPLAVRSSPIHYEILLRLRASTGELVSVAEYLAAAERYHMLERLDRWVIAHVVRKLVPDAARLRQSGIRFAVNVTGQALSEPSFADFVRAQIKGNGLPAGLLDFEFTETAAVRNLNAARRFIGGVMDVGSRIALDDFGTGLSSLGLLKDLPVQRIKIDGHFIRDVLVNPHSEVLVAALVEIARRLGLETVAEFVESAQTAAHLQTLGVTYAQGYLYGRARPLDDILWELREPRRVSDELPSADEFVIQQGAPGRSIW